MTLFLALPLFLIGLVLVIFFAERLVKGAVGTSAGFGVSTFVITVVFIGFDPENLAVGAAGSFEGVGGIALGSIIGAAMVAIGLAFGVTALIVPLKFETVPRRILAMPVLSVAVFAAVVWDGTLSRVDGTLLLVEFAAAIAALLWMSKKGIDVRPGGEVAETLEEIEQLSKWKSVGLLVVSLIAIVAGSELLVESSQSIITWLGLSDTVFGMTILAFLVSVEEIARELPAALKGRADITYGNVVGSILAFFCFNAGIIALIRPVRVESAVTTFLLPICAVTILATTLFMLTKHVPRLAGAILVLLYLVFVIGAYAGGM